ncbi:serine/threonine protein kinase [Sphingomonas sp. ABOLD]|nr:MULTISPECIES: serine/threonine-protein kinase [Sphingomonas]RSV39440.1 serine/threonine protein kinase [Sphingomonas sp. ABOLE]RSV49208.1 serine/threonine protein kinase [Sphingomonas sp. ABOLD]
MEPMPDKDGPGDDRTVVAIEPSAGGSLPGAGGGGRRGASLVPGDVLNGIYRVDRFIARGGMGEVFEGINVESDERVAIKAIRSHLAQEDKIIAMFRKEARVLTQIAHPAIVQYRVLARDPMLDLYYIVTDFIDGEPLSAHLGGLLPTAAEIAILARRLAAGLLAAHEHGAVHRDMSPDNVLLPGGAIERAKIIDFGIAKSLDIGGETVVGEGFAGKLGYVAPEQFGDFGRDVGPWTDVYSTALVLLAFARGKAPAMGNTLADAVERRRQLPDCDGLPPALVPLLRKMLAPNPAERIRSMAEVLAFLDSLVLPEEDAAGASLPPVPAPAVPSAPEAVFAPVRAVPAPAVAVAPKRPAAAPRPAPAPKRRRGKGIWALAALPVAGGAWWLVAAPASHPPAAPPPARQVARTVPQAPAVPRPSPAASQGPRVEMPEPASRGAALPVPTPIPAASPAALPAAKPTPEAPVPVAPVRKPEEDAAGKLVDLQKLERSHHWQSSGVGACYRFTGDWKLIGHTSKAACALTVFFNQCHVKSGLFGQVALRRNGARIEELRGRKWQALYADRRCG